MSDTTETKPLKPKAPALPLLEERIAAASAALRAGQRADGHWVYELEADATIPAEYVLFTHYLGEEPDLELEHKIGAYLRRRQSAEGGWPLFHGGAFDISASVKAYFALKMIGDDPQAEHMQTARDAILARGGAANVNVFTRILLALYGILPWSAIPLMPVEIMLLPAWFPFHLAKISYWGRTVLVPLLVVQALKPRARNPSGHTRSTNCSARRRRTPAASARRRIRSGSGTSSSAWWTSSCKKPSRLFRAPPASAPSTRRSPS